MSAHGTELPSRHVCFHGEFWRVSGPCSGVFSTAAPLRGARKVHVGHSELGVEIFEPHSPVRRQCKLDAGLVRGPDSTIGTLRFVCAKNAAPTVCAG